MPFVSLSYLLHHLAHIIVAVALDLLLMLARQTLNVFGFKMTASFYVTLDILDCAFRPARSKHPRYLLLAARRRIVRIGLSLRGRSRKEVEHKFAKAHNKARRTVHDLQTLLDRLCLVWAPFIDAGAPSLLLRPEFLVAALIAYILGLLPRRLSEGALSARCCGGLISKSLVVGPRCSFESAKRRFPLGVPFGNGMIYLDGSVRSRTVRFWSLARR